MLNQVIGDLGEPLVTRQPTLIVGALRIARSNKQHREVVDPLAGKMTATIAGPKSSGAAAAAYRSIRRDRADTLQLDVDAHPEFLDVDMAATAPSGTPTRTYELQSLPGGGGNTGGAFECG